MIDFSIIIPSFNKADFISETITSVLNQSYTNWELIIVDDGSTDNSIQVIEAYAKQDSRIQLFKRENLPKGGSVCRNLGLKKAKGKYVLFLDADDLLEPACLENRLLNIKANVAYNLWVFPIGTFYKSIGDSKSVWSPKGTNFLIQFLKHDLPWHTMSVIWHIDFIKNVKGFDMDYPRLQDVELHTRALLHPGVKLKTFPDADSDAFYRIDEKRTNQNVAQQLEKQKLGVFMYMEKISTKLESKKQYSAIKGTLFSFITTVNYRCLVETKLNEVHRGLEKEIIHFMKNQSKITVFDILYIQLYIFLYKFGFWRIKGFNYLFKVFFR
ncbi:glycosyltransferase family 2 protein [Winogradskyella sp. PAMC22761]|nr:glycosyltransferase family 2 protein [Winogradskyella sp. PAMC22761]